MVSRRQFVAGLGASAIVLGFDPLSRSWLTEASAATFDHVPSLDGMLVTDPTSLAGYAVDAGNIVHNTPVAVLLPGSVKDIQKMVRFCARRGIEVAARGQGHATFGQSQVAGGLVIDMSTLNEIHSILPTGADVDAGVKWNDLLTTSVPLGLTPPVLTGYLGLSIGGTLSVGGISSTNERGAQVDHVQELEVVTGEGQLKRCSRHHNRDLFEACLAGLGQFGIITRATIDMTPAPALVRVYQINYSDNAAFFADMRALLDRGELDDVYLFGVADGAGGWIYQLNLGKFYNPGSEPNDAVLLRDLSVAPAAAVIQDAPFVNYALRVDVAIDFFRSIGLWNGVLHPWFDVWLPDSTVEEYVGDVLPTLTPEDVGPTGFLLLFPQRNSKLRQKFLRVPECDEWVFLFDILTANAVPGPDPAFEARMLARNRALFEQARELGGTRYPIGALEFDHSDWVEQYGDDWQEFKALKRRFDPQRILAPGQGIF
mgnify:CR=1 FL=1